MSRLNAIAGAVAGVVCCALGSGTAVASERACARAASMAGPGTVKPASDAVLCVVNRERTTRGMVPLRISRLLTRSAQAHSRDMVARQYFAHVSPGGLNARRRILRTGYLRTRNATKVGETIAWGTDTAATPAALVRSFLNSPSHRAVLLDRRYRELGIGLVLGEPISNTGTGATLTLDFGRR